MSGHDPYRALGVPVDATGAEIVHAYRRLARASHPDVHPDDPGAAERFAVLADAYALLSDRARRAAHDRTNGEAWSGATHSTPTPGPSASTQAGVRQPTTTPAGASLWVGPVHIDPSPTDPRRTSDAHCPTELERLALLGMVTERLVGWWRR